MSALSDPLRARVIDANIEVHTTLAPHYDRDEPHFRPENQAKVRGVLTDLRRRAPGGRLLDLGCGTGFILRLGADLFDELHGVDVTPAMLARVPTASNNIFVHQGAAEQLVFDDASFDVVTAYSFLHHTADYAVVLREAFRALRPGGLLYVDLEPNRLFWSAVSALAATPNALFPELIQREIDAVGHTDEQVERKYGIRTEAFRQAEFLKTAGGIDPAQFAEVASTIGFRRTDLTLQWFLGQGTIVHGVSAEVASRFEEHLRQLTPLADHLFKYFRCVLEK